MWDPLVPKYIYIYFEVFTKTQYLAKKKRNENSIGQRFCRGI